MIYNYNKISLVIVYTGETNSSKNMFISSLPKLLLLLSVPM